MHTSYGYYHTVATHSTRVCIEYSRVKTRASCGRHSSSRPTSRPLAVRRLLRSGDSFIANTGCPPLKTHLQPPRIP